MRPKGLSIAAPLSALPSYQTTSVLFLLDLSQR
jgi:hypothetical protein